MQKRGNKGLSTIVTTLIIILLVLVAAGIIWVVVKNVAQKNAELIDFGKLTLDFNIEKISTADDDVFVTLKRNVGEGEFIALMFIVEDSSNSEAFRVNTTMNELELKTFNFTLTTINPEDIKKIKVYPIFRLESGKEVTGDVKATWKQGSSPVSQCSPNCPLGAQCGDNGCGGTCGEGCSSLTPICSDYQCTAEPCIGSCDGKICGDNGCGVSCGTCFNLHGSTICNTSFLCQPSCYPLWGDCDEDRVYNGCETSLETDNYNCGACGVVCGSTQTCIGGDCIFQGTEETWSNELMTNGGFELGDLTGWIVNGASWEAGVHPWAFSSDGGGVAPQSGSYCAYYAASPGSSSYYIYQDVDLTSYASSINAGTALINASGWGVSAEYGAQDNTRIQIMFLDSSKNILSTSLDTGYNDTRYWWKAGIYNYPIPKSTRYIRMWGSTYEGCCDSGSLDSFSVRIKAVEGGCNPTTCFAEGKNCGTISDGCGATLICGNYNEGCQTGYTCSNGVCVAIAPTCSDGIQNQGETGIDCGGPCPVCSSYLRTFYVSSSTGSDSNSGTSQSTPWQTLNKVNAQTFKAGDGILFKRGDIFYGTLTVSSSGTSSNSITYGAYGSGEKPIISGFTTVSGWTNEGNGIYSKSVSSQSTPNILNFNGKNTPMGRWPNTDWLTVDSHEGFASITDSALSNSPYDWDGAELVLRAHWWIITRNVITSHSGTDIYYTPSQDYYEAMDGNGYFIQNDVDTLDIVGDWAYRNGILYVYFGSNNPNNYVVKFPSIDDFAYLNNKDYITFDNLHITGYNDVAITIFSSMHTTVTNCLFDFIGNTAVDSPWQQYSDYPIVEYNIFEEINNDGIHFRGDSRYSSIQYNNLKNIGSIAGLSGSKDGCGIGISAEANETVIKYNNLKNIGYVGITFNGVNAVVSNNFIDTFCINKDDGAGIYTYEGEEFGKQITNNVIINGIGDEKFTRLPNEARAHGIYIDGSDNVLISGNSVGYVHGAGIFLNTQARNIDVFNNNIFDVVESCVMIISNMHNGGEITDLEMQNNIFVAKDSGEETLYYATTSGDDAVRNLGIVNNNYYARPIDDTNSIRTQTYAWNGPSIYRTLSGWQSYSGLDSNSKKSPKTISSTSDLRFEYNPISSTKTISLDRSYMDIKGITYSGSLTLQPYSSIILIKN